MLSRSCDLMVRGADMKRAQRGLFHGKQKLYGNKVSFSNISTRRSWTPNVQKKKLNSRALGVTLQIPVTTKALRCIDKAGGLDEYLLKTRPSVVDSKSGNALLQLIIPNWEKQNERPFDRRQYVYENRLLERAKKGRLTKIEAIELINKSRTQLIEKRKWKGAVHLLKVPEVEAQKNAVEAEVAQKAEEIIKQADESIQQTV